MIIFMFAIFVYLEDLQMQAHSGLRLKGSAG